MKNSVFLLFSIFAAGTLFAATPEEISVARDVIARFAGEPVAQQLEISSLPDAQGCPVYEIDGNGKTLRGSSGVAICKAFYMNAKGKGAAISSWSGNRFDVKAAFAPSKPVRVVSPFRHHQYLNAVTFGYTMPYWDEARWMEEIDWMALHGIDMPLALIANEAIAARVWKRLGLSEKEINDYLVGPAHLPWMRMGNLCERPDAPLPPEWRERSIRLQHAVLKRMRALGMKPIVPAFAGFLPRGVERLHPEIKLHEMNWCGNAFRSWFLPPSHPLFRKIGKMYVEEWEKEFGACTYYLADSFNEMELPWKSESEKLAGLAECGENVFGAIQDANPKAVWVMQGWMFGYQRHIWTPKRLAALLSRVPDKNVLLLDMALDYNAHFWRNGTNWELHRGFHGKPWIWSTIPNMGGKTANTGILEFYANGHLSALDSPLRGNLAGYGTAPEGIENNEVLYELISDAGWSKQKINLRDWLRNYARCRYGASPEALDRYWDGMLKSVYGSFTDHPRYGWQLGPGPRRGTVGTNEFYFSAIRAFAEAAPELRNSKLYALDLREQAALAAGAKLETVLRAESQASEDGDRERALKLRQLAVELFEKIDAVLAGHPTLDLRVWLGKARDAVKENRSRADYYETNARRIVTIWGPPVNDYSARVWSGLVGSYYLQRHLLAWKADDTGKSADIAAFEREWVENRIPLKKFKPCTANALISQVLAVPETLAQPASGTLIGQWKPTDVSVSWRELSWNVPLASLKAAKRLRFRYIKGNHRLDIAEVAIELDGTIVQRETLDGTTGIVSKNNVLQLKSITGSRGNNSCHVIARVKSSGGNDSFGVVELLK